MTAAALGPAEAFLYSTGHSIGPMIQRIGYDIRFELPYPTTMVTLLHVHPSRLADLRAPDVLNVEPVVAMESFHDSFGNFCTRFVAQAGPLRLTNSTLIYDSGMSDEVNLNARELAPHELPHEVLRYLYNSRYCEVDKFASIAPQLFGAVRPGWA